MTFKQLASVPMIAGLALALGAVPASAGHEEFDERDAKIVKLAHKLAKATDELYCDAYETRYRRSHRSWRALWALRGLDRRAESFLARVERDGARDWDTEREFRRLERAFRHADYRFHALHPRRQLRRDFERVEELMGKLDRRLAFVEVRDRDRDRRYGRRHRDGERHARIAWSFGF